ncbi:chalcone isomerase family protein [Dechloromonas sp. ZY10]|uniref:chalcone isomerase family protein n=1 Tax=Dechloromonas aquae TaxID=2664436 RepID=UPI00352830B8
MSSNLNWRIVDLVAPGARQPGGHGQPPNPAKMPVLDAARRRYLLAFAGLPLAAFADPVLESPWPGLRRWGQGEFSRFGFRIYRATLWAGDDLRRPPLALRLDYHRAIRSSQIVDASLREMRTLGTSEVALERWGARLAALLPDVRPGDYIVGVHRGDAAWFAHNGRFLGEIAEAAFADAFFAIWLDPRTSEPGLRQALLGSAGG